MKKFISISAVLAILAMVACNNSENKTGETTDTKKIQADSLEKEVMDGHDAGMAKMSKISRLQQETQRLIDSIEKLPAKAKQAAAPYKTKLESLLNDLKNAGASMNTWMEEFNYDSARDNLEQRIKYLSEEKLKVSKVKKAIGESLAAADSVIKSKF